MPDDIQDSNLSIAEQNKQLASLTQFANQQQLQDDNLINQENQPSAGKQRLSSQRPIEFCWFRSIVGT